MENTGITLSPAPRWSRRTWLKALTAGGAWPLMAGAQEVQTPWPQTLVLEYDVSGQARGLPYRASSQLTWNGQADRYEAQLDMRIRLLGRRTQRSSGRWSLAGMQPALFIDQARRERRFEIDGLRQQFRLFREGELVREGPLAPGSQDHLTLFFELALRAHRQAGRFTPEPWVVPVMGHHGAEPWTFVWKGAERLDIPAGHLPTQRLERQPREPEDTHMSLWLHEALGWLPVRILLQDPNGDVVDQRLRSWPPP